MRPTALIAVLGLMATACFLDDRPSRRAAKQAAELVRPGMTMDEVVTVTQGLADDALWTLTLDECGGERHFGVQRAGAGAGFLVTTFDGNGERRASQAVVDQGALARVLGQAPYRDCRKVDIGLGEWGVPVERDEAGRVKAVLRPSFVD